MISDAQIFFLFFKAFSIAFSALYLLYAVVLYQTTKSLLNILKAGSAGLMKFIGLLQIIAGVILLVYSLFFI